MKVTGPLLNPICRLVPPIMGLDFSPLILLLLLQLIESILVNLLRRIG